MAEVAELGKCRWPALAAPGLMCELTGNYDRYQRGASTITT
jgi:hypothetical protein